MAGLVCVNDADIAKQIAFLQNAEGSGLAPFDCWLLIRGIKTMSLRIERSQYNAEKVAEFLVKHPLVRSCYFPGYYIEKDKNSQRDFQKETKIHFQQCKGRGSVLSFDTGNLEYSKTFLNSLNLFKSSVSFGSVTSLAELPILQSHASITPKENTLPPSLVRLSIGIEHIDDIIEDLSEALNAISNTKSKL